MPTNTPILAEQIHIESNGSPLASAVMTSLLEADIELSRDVPDVCTLRFIDPDATLLDDTAKFPLGGTLKVSFNDDANTKTAIFSGEITAVEGEFEVGSGTVLVIRAYDFSHRLNRQVHVRTFLDQTHSDIVTKIVKEVGLQSQTESTSVTYKYVIQDAQTNYEFIRDLAARNGYEVRIEEKKLIFGKPQATGSSIALNWGSNLVEFHPRLSLIQQVKEVNVYGWNPTTKEAIVGQATSSTVAPEIGEAKKTGMAGVTALTNPSSPKKISVYRPVISTAEADALAKALLDDINAQYVEADGKSLGNPKIKSGVKLNITNVSRRFSGSYVVTTVRHLYTLIDGYVTLFQVEGPRPRLISELLSNVNSQSGAAGEQGKVWNGVYPAIVTNVNDPDGMGRIKVKFPWLGKDGQGNDIESAWARFVTMGAGNQRGTVWYPEINDEVVVAFERGDLNFPYVMGTLWNGKDKLPPDQKTFAGSDGKINKRAIVTRTGHTLVFSDEAGQEKIELFDKTKKNKITIDTPSNTIKIESEGPTQIITKGKTEVTAQADVTVKSQANVKIEAQANADVKATGNATVEATGSATVKGATVTIQGSGPVEIKGAIVKIN